MLWFGGTESKVRGPSSTGCTLLAETENAVHDRNGVKKDHRGRVLSRIKGSKA